MSDAKAPPAEAPAAAAPAPSGGGAIAAWLPVLAAIVLAPALTLGVAQFVLLPSLEARLGGSAAESPADGSATAASAKKGAPGTPGAKVISYRFENVVVNLAGTMGTRYLKASFEVSGTHPDLISRFDVARPQLGDTTLATLSSLSLADLEEPGAKNIIRERLIEAYNRVFGERIAENLYFSEFVVQ